MNKKTEVKLKIKPEIKTDFICSVCDGFGVINMKPTVEKAPIPGKDYRTIKCKFCGGRGYLDWIEQVLGVKK
jgi:transcription elongation factor Elf1